MTFTVNVTKFLEVMGVTGIALMGVVIGAIAYKVIFNIIKWLTKNEDFSSFISFVISLLYTMCIIDIIFNVFPKHVK